MTENPTLYVIAGCNGAGKSSYSNAITNDNLTPFDYDIHYLKIYKSLTDSELRDRIAHNLTRNLLEENIQKSISKRNDFCYETNFNSTPLYWPEIFKQANFNTELIYFCLDSIDQAKKRVRIRVENGGHFVPDFEIESRFYEGYKNLDENFHRFDIIHLLDSSKYAEIPKHLLSMESGRIVAFSSFPSFLNLLLPKIHKDVKKGFYNSEQ
jgi:predicted ABC-type ATPase